MSVQLRWPVAVAEVVLDTTPFVFTAGEELDRALRNHCQGVLYVSMLTFVNAPTNVNTNISNNVLSLPGMTAGAAQTANLMGKNFGTPSDGAMEAFVCGWIPNEGEYDGARDSVAPLHDGFQITFDVAGGGTSSMVIDAELVLVPSPGL